MVHLDSSLICSSLLQTKNTTMQPYEFVFPTPLDVGPGYYCVVLILNSTAGGTINGLKTGQGPKIRVGEANNLVCEV